MTRVSRAAFEFLGIAPGAGEAEIRSAWKALALTAHPDQGGTHARMVALNAALEEALRTCTASPGAEIRKHREGANRSFSHRDVSSFTIASLPVDAFETLVVAAANCGQVIDDDPPYLVEFTLADTDLPGGSSALCRCELVPEAGATTVHIGLSGARHVSIEQVRDILVATVNEVGDQSFD